MAENIAQAVRYGVLLRGAQSTHLSAGRPTGYRGGTASGSGRSWHGTTAGGESASGYHTYHEGSYATYHGDAAGHYYGGTYSSYHPPTTVNQYYDSGCTDCGGWAAAGAAAAGVAAGRAAGYAAASAASAPPPPPGQGAIYTALPAGCVYRPILQVYGCEGMALKAAYGANGVYYRVVAP